MEHKIVSVEAWLCSLPLAQPIDLGSFVVRSRVHLAVRVRTDSGLQADCVTQTRGSPVDVVVADVVAPRIIGQSALDIAARRRELESAMTALEFDGAIGRGWSAIEICLQDLRAQAAEIPLWRGLGGDPQAVHVKLVEGYPLPDESDDSFVRRLVARVEEGFTLLKIAGAYADDGDKLVRRLTLFRSLAGPGPRLIVDFAWSWVDAASRGRLMKQLEELAIDWVEDPFPRTAVKQFLRLKEITTLPIGAGDEATRPSDLQALMDASAIDVLRLDCTTVGGLAAAQALAVNAHRSGLRVSFHEHPEVHQHCVFGWGVADHIEMFPLDRPFDRVHDLIEDHPLKRAVGGRLKPSDEPGTGIRLRDEAVARFAKRYTKVGA